MQNPVAALINRMSQKNSEVTTSPSLPRIDVSTRADVKLGQTVREKITGFMGIVIAISQEIDGSVQVGIQPRSLDSSGNPAEPYEFDIERIEVVDDGGECAILNKNGSDVGISLGARYRDEVTGLEGIAVRLVEFIGGCNRVVLRPKVDKHGQAVAGTMIPIEQVTLLDEEPAKIAAARSTQTGGPGTSERSMMSRMSR